jgi:hypothetical protein
MKKIDCKLQERKLQEQWNSYQTKLSDPVG